MNKISDSCFFISQLSLLNVRCGGWLSLVRLLRNHTCRRRGFISFSRTGWVRKKHEVSTKIEHPTTWVQESLLGLSTELKMVFGKVTLDDHIPYPKLELVSQLVVQHVLQVVAKGEGEVLEFLGQAIPYMDGE